jgi:DNA-binding PadR family transcriptional regulator
VTLALSKVWSPRPVSLSIVEILEKKGAMTDLELQKELKSNFGEISFREINTELMRLEMAGVLRVSRLMKGKRQVELTGKPVID